jgi:hypothetical protein
MNQKSPFNNPFYILKKFPFIWKKIGQNFKKQIWIFLGLHLECDFSLVAFKNIFR